MSVFKAEVVPISLLPHSNADTLSLVQVKGWTVVVKTELFLNEKLGVYIPIDAIAPADHPLLGFLEGKRVKTEKRRGVYSEGVLLPISKVINTYILFFKRYPEVGDDLTTLIGITKYEEPFHPIGGEIKGEYTTVKRPDWLDKYSDIENFNNYPDIIQVGEGIQITEKLHGTSVIYGLVDNKFYISSRNLCIRTEPKDIRVFRFRNKLIIKLVKFLKLNNLEIFKKTITLPIPRNWWTIPALELNIEKKLKNLADLLQVDTLAVYGEVVSSNIQDLSYGFERNKYGFFAYDLRVKGYNKDYYMYPNTFNSLMEEAAITICPILKTGEFSKEDLNLRNGKSTVPGANNIREGIVIKPLKPRYDPTLGRVILKSISEDFHMRKNSKDTKNI